MNKKQNLLPSKFIAKYTAKYAATVAMIGIIVIGIITGVATAYSKYLDIIIEEGREQVEVLNKDKSKYDDISLEVENLRATKANNDQTLSNLETLYGDFSEFDLLLTYITDMKPYNVTIISVENNIDTVDYNNKVEEQDIAEDTNSEDEYLTTDDTEATEEGSGATGESTEDDSVIGEVGTEVVNNTPNNQENLVYNGDIGNDAIILRGYGTNIGDISDYITSLASAPEVSGYTINGLEDKLTEIEGTNIILFEVKLIMGGI